MITSEKFEDIIYKKPHFYAKKNITSLRGIDTESYQDGKPFLCCLDDGTILDLNNFPYCMFSFHTIKNLHIGTYNLKYDSGAFIYFLDHDLIMELWKMNTVTICREGIKCKIEYIPHKLLKMTLSKRTVFIWDILQYYKQSLDNAAKKYLGKNKIDVETKTFTKEYVEKNYYKLVKYCTHDAYLCKELGCYLLDKLKTFKMRPSALYSGASLSLNYYSDNSKVSTIWRIWNNTPDLIKMCLDTYQGGKFEVTQRGYFENIYEYDISSAYPYEITNLYDLTLAKIIKSSKYNKNAIYGFIKCIIDNRKGKYLPCGVGTKIRIYPAGVIHTHVTKAEYDYIVDELNLDIKIVEAYWIMLDLLIKPYEKITKKIFDLKKSYKNVDSMLYNLTKVIANSFYGKTVQLIENNEEKYVAGTAFNPIHGSIITANTRIKVSRIQNEYEEDCVAVHTDSVMIKKPLHQKYITNELGGFEYVANGKTILISCGMYQLDDLNAYKGFEPEYEIDSTGKKKYETWQKILLKNNDKYVIPYPVRRVRSWIECCSQNKLDKLQQFFSDVKQIDLNCDRKRLWGKDMKAEDFLFINQSSLPMIIIN